VQGATRHERFAGRRFTVSTKSVSDRRLAEARRASGVLPRLLFSNHGSFEQKRKGGIFMKSEVFRKGFLGVFLLGLIFVFSGHAHAQQWAQTYGGAGNDVAVSTKQTADGGYIVAGYTGSFGAGGNDFWVSKLDASGTVTWQKTYGGAGNDCCALSTQQTADGGYIVAASTDSFGAGGLDVWVLKLDASGNVTWQKTYGGAGIDGANAIQQTTDGGYIVAGLTRSFGAGLDDVWVLKLDALGAVTWQKTYGGTADDVAYSIQQTTDGGYIVAGRTSSSGAGGMDVWVLKLDALGAVTWQKAYGGAGNDVAGSIKQTSDGGYIVAGWTTSFGAGGMDIWVLKLDALGNVTWQKAYGGAGNDSASSTDAIQQTSDGGYIVAGTTSFGAGSGDVWVLKLDASGTITWQKTYGGASSDGAYAVQQTSDGGYIVAGYTASFGAGGNDVWVLKLDASGNIPTCGPQGTSSATVTVTGVAPVVTVVAAPSSTVVGLPTIATITNSTVTPAQVCSFAAPTPTPTPTPTATPTATPTPTPTPTPGGSSIPTLSGWGLMSLLVLIGLASIYRLTRI
jgi:predicted secreted protein